MGKKPTNMELKNAVTNLIQQMANIMQALNAIDVTLGSYIEFKKDSSKFQKWIKKEYEKKRGKKNVVQPNKKSKKTIKVVSSK